MGLAIDVFRVAANTSTGNQTLTGDVGGLTPKAALFILSGAVTDGTERDDSITSYGAATGVDNEWSVGGMYKHNVTTTDGTSWNTNDSCVAVYDETVAPNQIARANFVSFGTDNVVINWSDAPPVAYLLTVVLFAGTDLSAHANWLSAGNVVDTTIDVTDPGFEPHILLTGLDNGHVAPLTTGTTNIHQDFALGFVHNDGASGITQYTLNHYWQGNQTSGRHLGDVRNDCGIVESTASVDWKGEFGTFDSSGFSMTTTINGGNNREVYYLALKFGSFSSWVGPYTTPTSTGSDSSTLPGFKPQFLQVFATQHTVYNAPIGPDARAATHGLFSIDPSAQFANSVSSEEDAATSNVQSLSDNIAIQLPDDDGTTRFTGTLTSFDTNGWTWNFSATDTGTARQWFAIAIEDGGVNIDDSQPAYASGQLGVNEIDVWNERGRYRVKDGK